VQAPAGAWLRRLPFLAFTCLSTLAWAALIAFAFFLVTPAVLGVEAYPAGTPRLAIARDAAFAFAVAFTLSFAVRVQALIGGRVLFNFLLGRYHRPIREARVFMFLDLVGSTRLSEELGDVRVQEFIGRFFFDIARPIAEHGGETYRYIGDEVVVSWPMDRALTGARCIACVLAIDRLVARLADDYSREFGTVPSYRIGMHGGPVVVSEIGDDRRAIVYFGETLGIAVALRGHCKRVGRDLLLSAELYHHFELPRGVTGEPVEPLVVSGGERISVYALSREEAPKREGAAR